MQKTIYTVYVIYQLPEQASLNKYSGHYLIVDHRLTDWVSRLSIKYIFSANWSKKP